MTSPVSRDRLDGILSLDVYGDAWQALLAAAAYALDADDRIAALEAEVERLTALVNAKQSWIDGAKVDLDGYADDQAEYEVAVVALTAERDALRERIAALEADLQNALRGLDAYVGANGASVEERDEARAERDALRERVAALEAEVAGIRDRADRLEEEGFVVGGVWGDYGETVVPLHAVEWVVSGVDEAVTPETDPDMAATWRDRVATAAAERDALAATIAKVRALCDRYEHADERYNPPTGQQVAAKVANILDGEAP